MICISTIFINANLITLAKKTLIWYTEHMGHGCDITADFKANPSAELLGVFEFMQPVAMWDEYSIVFFAKIGDEVKLYHYLTEDENDPEEWDKVWAALEFFRQKGIEMDINLGPGDPTPIYSRVLYPAEDLGKPFYVVKTPSTIWKKIYRYFSFVDEFQLNKELSITEQIRTVTYARWHYDPIYLYGGIEGTENQFRLEPNW